MCGAIRRRLVLSLALSLVAALALLPLAAQLAPSPVAGAHPDMTMLAGGATGASRSACLDEAGAGGCGDATAHCASCLVVVFAAPAPTIVPSDSLSRPRQDVALPPPLPQPGIPPGPPRRA